MTKIKSLLLLLLLSAPLHAYQGGALKNHAHTTGAGDGGALTVGTTLLGASALSSFQGYRRPQLQYTSTGTITVESGVDGTANEVAILFPDNDYRVNSSTRQVVLDVTRGAIVTGNHASGLRTGSVATNTWYYAYAVKDTDDSGFIITADTVAPTQANYSFLNSTYTSNGYVYLGPFAYGDGTSGANNVIMKFAVDGGKVCFYNIHAGDSGMACGGVQLSAGVSVASLTWSYSTSSTVGTGVPATALIGTTCGGMATGGTKYQLSDSAGSRNYMTAIFPAATASYSVPGVILTQGVKQTASGTLNQDLSLSCFYDYVLSGAAEQKL